MEVVSKQIFNADETGLFWKRMPSRTYIAEEEKSCPGFKAAKDRFTLLLSGNANGDFKMKPLLISRSQNPRALKGYLKEHLPVIYKANSKAWIIAVLFREWIKLYAIPAWKEYCAKENLDFKILLLLDNASAHPVDLSELHPHVKVVFIRPNTTSLIQPMDQGVIATFKAYYLRRTFEQLLKETDGEGKPSIREWWKQFTILRSIDNISTSWEEVTEKCMNGVWRKIWPDGVNDFSGFDAENVLPEINQETLQIAQEAGFTDLGSVDIDELLASHGNELTNEELEELAKCDKDETSVNANEEPQRLLTMKGMASAFRLIEEGLNILGDEDPNHERFSKVQRVVLDGIQCYREIYKDKMKSTKQSTLHRFMFSKNPSAVLDASATSETPSVSQV